MVHDNRLRAGRPGPIERPRHHEEKIVNSTIAPPASLCELDLRSDLDDARDLGTIASGENLTIRAAQGVKSVWLTLALDGS